MPHFTACLKEKNRNANLTTIEHLFVVFTKTPDLRLTSQMAFSAVSVPSVKSVPGTLLLIVAGIIVIGMQNSGCFSLDSAIISRLWYAYTFHRAILINKAHG